MIPDQLAEDHTLADAMEIPVRAARTLMRSLEDKVDTQRALADFCAALKPASRAVQTAGATS